MNFFCLHSSGLSVLMNKTSCTLSMAWSLPYVIHFLFQYQSTPLMFASKRGNVDVMKLLVDRGADVNYANLVCDLCSCRNTVLNICAYWTGSQLRNLFAQLFQVNFLELQCTTQDPEMFVPYPGRCLLCLFKFWCPFVHNQRRSSYHAGHRNGERRLQLECIIVLTSRGIHHSMTK